jgi:NDP-sugar pyrophosphorylase family protein
MTLSKDMRKRGAIMTIALTRVEKVEEYGIAELDKDLRIESVEKPPAERAPSNFANAGIYLFSPEVRKIVES